MADSVLVTGGAGFIGSHLSDSLIRCGYRVRILDNLSVGRREWAPPAAEFIEGDIRDLETCRKAAAGCRGIFHVAAMSRSGASLAHVEACTANNLIGTQNILIAARDVRVKKVVYSGSSTYYGNQPGPHQEAMRPDFLSLHALTKYAGEEYCLMFDRLYGVPGVVLRYFNVYGPRQPETGAYGLVLGVFLRRWAEGRPLEIHGDGRQRRDFVHVRDVARANICAYESPVHGEVFNIGTGMNFSVQELADMISFNQNYGPKRLADARTTLADLTRTREVLGWEPEIRFEDGLQELKELASSEVGSAVVLA